MGGRKFEACLKLLEMGAHDKCCAQCYYCYFKKFLDFQSRDALLSVSKDCMCDYMPRPAIVTAGSSTTTQSGNGREPEGP